MSATATRLPRLMPVEKPPEWQDQYDALAANLKRALERIDALERKLGTPPTLIAVEEFVTVQPATKNAPARRHFDAAALIAAIADRTRP